MKRSARATAQRLDQLAGQYGVGPDARAGLEAYLGLMARPEAPTTVHEPARAVDVHVADALVALALPAVREASVVADVGAGAGVPGIPLALALPDTRVVLLESQARKCAFLTTAITHTGAANAEVVCARAEAWEAGRGACDVVAVRAVATLAVLCEYAAPLLRLGGVLVAWKGDVDQDEREDGRAAAETLGLEPVGAEPVVPYPGSERRRLFVYRKTAATPERFPRRAGMAAKRPLQRMA